MSLSKKVRFEVFKRDGFQCAYCGNTPPKVVLEVDHVTPKSRGGDDNLHNLLTACFDCNRGKRDVPLDQIPPPLRENFEALKEREQQLREYSLYLTSVEHRFASDIDEISRLFESCYPEWSFVERFKHTTLRRFLQDLSKHEIMEALRISISKFPQNNEADRNNAIRYMCGICWKKIKSEQ